MRIAIFSTHPTFVTHLESELEIAQNYLNLGYEVDFYICNDRSLKCCDNVLSVSLSKNEDYSKSSESVCNFCISRQANGFKLLEGNFNVFPLITKNQIDKEYCFDDIYLQNVKKFKELYYDDVYDIGWSLLSSFITYTRIPFIQLLQNSEVIKKLYSESIKVYESAKEILQTTRYDKVYLFNTRLSYTRGLFRLAQNLDIPTYVHERGSDVDKYEVYINNNPHNITFFYEEVNRYWRSSIGVKKYFIGKLFFKRKMNGFGGSWKSYTTNFIKGSLPDSFNPNNENITLFTSSEDEFQSIDKTWNNPFFENQLKGIEYLCEEISKKKNKNLFIRVHPNSIDLDSQYLENMFSFSQYKNVHVIPPDSSVNSYDLIFNSSKIISFGTTLTMEAIYWGKPVVLLANSFFNKFKGPIIPSNFDEIKQLCFEKKLTKPSKYDSLKVGYYLSVFGLKYKYYKPIDYKSGYFKGVNLSTGEVMPIKESFLRHKINLIKGFLFRIYIRVKVCFF